MYGGKILLNVSKHLLQIFNDPASQREREREREREKSKEAQERSRVVHTI